MSLPSYTCVSVSNSHFGNWKEEVDILILHSPTVTCIYRVFRDIMRTTPRQGRIPLICLFALIFCTGVNVAAVKAKAASSLRPDELQLDVTYNLRNEKKAQQKYLAQQRREVDRSKKQLRIELQNMKEQVTKVEKEQGDKLTKAEIYQHQRWCMANPKYSVNLHRVDCSSLLKVDVATIKKAILGGKFNENSNELRKLRDNFGLDIIDPTSRNVVKKLPLFKFPTLLNPCWQFVKQCLPSMKDFDKSSPIGGLGALIDRFGISQKIEASVKGASLPIPELIGWRQ